MDTQPQELFTVAILGTYAGSTGAVYILYSTFRRLLNRDNLWATFIISMIVSFVVAFGTGALNGLVEYFLAVLNGALLFSSATGSQEVLAGGTGNRQRRNPRSITSSWLGE